MCARRKSGDCGETGGGVQAAEQVMVGIKFDRVSRVNGANVLMTPGPK